MIDILVYVYAGVLLGGVAVQIYQGRTARQRKLRDVYKRRTLKRKDS